MLVDRDDGPSPLAGMLGRVLHCLQHAEVDGGFDVGRVAADVVVNLQLRRQRETSEGGAEGGGQALVHQ